MVVEERIVCQDELKMSPSSRRRCDVQRGQRRRTCVEGWGQSCREKQERVVAVVAAVVTFRVSVLLAGHEMVVSCGMQLPTTGNPLTSTRAFSHRTRSVAWSCRRSHDGVVLRDHPRLRPAGFLSWKPFAGHGRAAPKLKSKWTSTTRPPPSTFSSFSTPSSSDSSLVNSPNLFRRH